MAKYEEDAYTYGVNEIIKRDYTIPLMDDVLDECRKVSYKDMYTATTKASSSFNISGGIPSNDLINGNWTTTSINPIWNSDYTIRQPFSKTEFLQALSKGTSLKSVVRELIKSLNDDGVIDLVEFLMKLDLLEESIFWELAYESHHVYIMGQDHHTVSDCVKFIEHTTNKVFVTYTRDDVRENHDFCKQINKLKLKGII